MKTIKPFSLVTLVLLITLCFSGCTENAEYVLEKSTSYDQNNKISYRIEYEYDNSPLYLSSSYYGTDGELTFRTVYEYDKSGQLLCQTTYDDDNNFLHSVTYEYDNNGNCTNDFTDYYDENDCSKTYEYDENGNIIKQAVYFISSDNKIITSYENTYDADNRLIRQYTIDIGEYVLFEYDDVGRVISEDCFGTGDELEVHREYEYDKRGNLQNEITYNPDGSVSDTIVYKYKKINVK